MAGRAMAALVAAIIVAATQVGGSSVGAGQLSLRAAVGGGEVLQQTTSLITKSHSEVIANLKKDAENQKRIMAEKHKRRSGGDDTSAHSMSPHLSHHAARGEEAGGSSRGRGTHAAKTGAVQDSIHGVLKLPPDEATPFFDTYVLKYAFPTIALICSCLACILFRTMRMYQKERWKGTSYFHGARRSAESLLPGLK
mmetsp:Transcript_5829/g.14935  ORF Transcript_5829/g.14935 Transcript_5829/m.14935 type:complete len:196 (-) Transcript_5829:117-704(-)|eukprot:CAMPEP_0174929790 /NCGR_PEP_ID=MMETSP1355-20121228/28691_1 /TAXON_ID=464990 /ORGANISM="Hemiselmis tepida, Strain CCMP443" /LENGTH=195 /DNA_ID=CAMNT_0016176027 /DNA_START=72 /DNA_END=659 /DNA_ORIENTATION=+